MTYEVRGVKRTDTTITVKDLLILDGAFEFWEDRKGQTLLVNGRNEVYVSGNLTQDSKTTKTQTGSVTKTRVAVKDANSTLFIDVTAWSALELKKGQGVSITGRLLSDSYRSKEKKRVYTTYLEAGELRRLASLTK